MPGPARCRSGVFERGRVEQVGLHRVLHVIDSAARVFSDPEPSEVANHMAVPGRVLLSDVLDRYGLGERAARDDTDAGGIDLDPNGRPGRLVAAVRDGVGDRFADDARGDALHLVAAGAEHDELCAELLLDHGRGFEHLLIQRTRDLDALVVLPLTFRVLNISM